MTGCMPSISFVDGIALREDIHKSPQQSSDVSSHLVQGLEDSFYEVVNGSSISPCDDTKVLSRRLIKLPVKHVSRAQLTGAGIR